MIVKNSVEKLSLLDLTTRKTYILPLLYLNIYFALPRNT